MLTNSRSTFQGGAKCILPFLLMSVDIFARQNILTECSCQLSDYVEVSHERWVLLFSFINVKLNTALISVSYYRAPYQVNKFKQSFEYLTFTKTGTSFLDWHFGVEGTTEGMFWWMENGIIMMGCGKGIPEGRDWKSAQGSHPLQMASSFLTLYTFTKRFLH